MGHLRNRPQDSSFQVLGRNIGVEKYEKHIQKSAKWPIDTVSTAEIASKQDLVRPSSREKSCENDGERYPTPSQDNISVGVEAS